MKTPEEKRWERMQQLLLAEAGGGAQPRISSQRTLFGIKSHVEEVIEKVAAEETKRCIDEAKGSAQGTHAGSLQSHLDAVREYVARNIELRAAVGATPDTTLVPRPLGEGEHNLNYVVGTDARPDMFVLRVNIVPQPFHEDQIAYEASALTAIEQSGCTPRLLYTDSSVGSLGKGCLAESFCEGEMLDFDDLRPGDLACAAQLMADVHSVPVGDCGLMRPADPLRDLFDECMERIALYKASGHEDARITAWADAFVKKAVIAIEAAGKPVDANHIINTEPVPSHFLIPRDAAEAAAGASGRGRFCDRPGYFIDWERPIVGEVAQDVAYFVSPTTTFWDSDFMFQASDIAGFVEDYWRAVDGRFSRDGFDRRFAAYRTVTALRSMSWCCKALIRYAADSGGHKTEKTISKLDTYLSDEFLTQVMAQLSK